MLDQNEITAAADRLRRHYEAIKTSETYDGSPYYECLPNHKYTHWAGKLFNKDVAILTNAYFADQQAKAEADQDAKAEREAINAANQEAEE